MYGGWNSINYLNWIHPILLTIRTRCRFIILLHIWWPIHVTINCLCSTSNCLLIHLYILLQKDRKRLCGSLDCCYLSLLDCDRWIRNSLHILKTYSFIKHEDRITSCFFHNSYFYYLLYEGLYYNKFDQTSQSRWLNGT